MKKPKRTSAAVVKEQRAIQKAMDTADQKQGSSNSKNRQTVQTEQYPQPGSSLPQQHLLKPGSEKKLRPAPRFLARGYLGSNKLKDKVALITGGDSGIGRAVAILFAREGAHIALAYLCEHEDARETKRHIKKEGSKCLLLPGDIRTPEYCRHAVQRTIEKFGHIDILVNNAAFQEHAESIEVLSDEHFDMTMKTNIYGYFNMTKAAVPYLPSGGAIINTGSETGLFGSKKLLDYSATKGAIHAFTLSLATSLRERGIRVNAVAPGPVWTPLNPADRSASEVAQFGNSSGMKRPAQPEEISPAYVYLAASICSSYVTGIVLPIMGGVTPHG